jgi:hypothetical protein
VTATALVAGVATTAILRKTHGVPAVPLDDAFIHFQYARAFARLHPFEYTPGAAPTPGATSLLWPLLLAPFYAIGFKGVWLIPIAWLFGFVSLGLLAYETWRISQRLLAHTTAIAASAMVLAFGGYIWCAASGMEVVPFAWLLMRSARRAAEWGEASGVATRRERLELVALALLTPLMRPEGAVASLLIAVALFAFPRGRARTRAWAALPLCGPLIMPLIELAATGHFGSTTAQVKWLPLNPYYGNGRFTEQVLENLRVLFNTLLDGRIWSAVYVPQGSRWVTWLALPALALMAARRRTPWRGLCVGVVALGMLLPTTYDSFLWNRLRYLWPFAAAWFVALGALADAAGALAARLSSGLGWVRILVAGAFLGGLVSHVSWTLEDLATSSDAIRRQQASLGHWAHDALPPDARLGVNDTGAIAYFSDRRVFDICGLTTRGEARYWVAGTGSRFEHYEHMKRSELPTHFIVYPEWMGLPWLLGRQLTERTVHGATILGGTTMYAHVADYSALGSGDRPLSKEAAGKKTVDVLDVADLESEASHDYRLYWAEQVDDVPVGTLDGRVDGARKRRSLDTFTLKLSPGGVLIGRFGAARPMKLRVRIDGHDAGTFELEGYDWEEPSLGLRRDLQAGPHRIDISAPSKRAFASMHYWSLR